MGGPPQPVGRPQLRPGGPGPPQVGVQPWADPPQPRFQAPQATPPPQAVMVRPPQQQAPMMMARPQQQQQQQQIHQQQQQQQQRLKQQEQQAAQELGVDLTGLSDEERARILSVMARAHDMDEDYERHKRVKEELESSEARGAVVVRLPCPLCQVADLAHTTNKMCGDCGKNFCQKCGTFVPGEGRRSVWVCNTCSNRRKQQSVTMTTQQQDANAASGQKGVIDPNRKDESMSRMGQPFQGVQQPQSATMSQQPFGQQQQPMGQQPQQQQQPSVSLLGSGPGTGGGGVIMSGSLIPNSAVGGARGGATQGSIPRTVPLAALPQQQQPQQQWTGQQQPGVQQQTGLMQTAQQQQQQQPMSMTQQLQAKAMELAPGLMSQAQQQQQQPAAVAAGAKPEWSPATDLSPIMDVSPSLEAAEQELMEKQQRGIPRAQSGTISSLLADFNKSVGQTTPTIDDGRGFGLQPQTMAQTQPQQQQLVVQPQQQQFGLQPQQQQQTFSLQPQQQQPPFGLQPQQQQQQQKTMVSTVMAPGGTEMDQNQNLVQQHQFRLQQQQFMIQQQQQVIHQQQQQIQHQQQLQQQTVQQVVYQDMQQVQQQTMVSVAQQAMVQPQQQQQLQPGAIVGGTPMQQQQQAPTQRKDQESLEKKIRRRLPPVPLDQEPTTAPLRRSNKDRGRTLSVPLSASADRGAWRTPHRTTSLDDGMALSKVLTTSTGSILDSLGLSSYPSDTYRKLLDLEGLLGTATTTTTTTSTTTSVLDSIPSSVGLASSLLGRRDLSAPHSLSLYRGGEMPGTTSFHTLEAGRGLLPSYIASLKQHLRDELRTVADTSRRRITDPDLSGLLSHPAWSPADDPLSRPSLPLSSGGARVGGTGRRSRHRRHASDTKLSAFSSLSRDDPLEDPLVSRYKLWQSETGVPFKSYEFESIDDRLGGPLSYRGSSLRGSSLGEETLRDTSLAPKEIGVSRRYGRLRRHTDTGLSSLGGGGLLGGGPALDPYGLRPPRSWHPSPYGSEDEEEREEKKAKIKAEIARRRQHLLEEGHLRTTLPMHHSMDDRVLYTSRGSRGHYTISTAGYTSPLWNSYGGLESSSFLDEDLMNRRGHAYMSPPGYRTVPRGWSSYDAVYPDDLLVSDPYSTDSYMVTAGDEAVEPMPLLPDMPTRSRRLLHDLGSAPIATGPPTLRTSRAGPHSYDEYEVEDQRRVRHASSSRDTSAPTGQLRKPQSSKAGPKYDFPVKRILLTRDPKDRSVSGNGLGMKVVGGKEIPGGGGTIGAYVARIYPGGVVETLGEVREGDQVLEWNGAPLTGKTYEEVQRIIATSGDEVEIVIRSDFNMLSPRSSSHHHHGRHRSSNHHERSGTSRGSPRHHHSSSYHQDSYHYENNRTRSSGTNRGNYDSPTLRSPTEEGLHNSYVEGGYNSRERSGSVSPPSYRTSSRHHHAPQTIGSPTGKADTSDNKEKYRAENISGEIQLQVCYDSKASILYVTIVRARNLVTSRDNSGLPDPYVKCYLLPDRRVENQRRTRYFSRCSDPEWKQTMVYPQVPQDQLKKKHLEISVWNYDINGPPEFLGEVVLDLSDTSVIDEQSRWYKLHPHDPKKYPSQSTVNGETGGVKMARLNNPAGTKTAYDQHHQEQDTRKQQHTA